MENGRVVAGSRPGMGRRDEDLCSSFRKVGPAAAADFLTSTKSSRNNLQPGARVGRTWRIH